MGYRMAILNTPTSTSTQASNIHRERKGERKRERMEERERKRERERESTRQGHRQSEWIQIRCEKSSSASTLIRGEREKLEFRNFIPISLFSLVDGER